MSRKITEEQRKKIIQKRNQNRKLSIKIASIFLGIILLLVGGKIVLSKVFGNKAKVETKKETSIESNKESTKETEVETNIESQKEINSNIDDEEDISVDILNSDEIEANQDGQIVNKYANINISKENLDKKIDKLPDPLKKKIELYPESMTTIVNYKDSENTISKDISKDIESSKSYNRKIKLPYLNQWDERWGYEKVDDEYIAISGCGPTSLSMIYTGLTGDVTKNPYEMAKFAFENGWYDKQGGKYDLFTEGARELGFDSVEIKSNAESIKENLDEGKIIVALVQPNEYKDFSATGRHYVVITEYNDENKLVIYDVNSYENTNKTWDFDRVLDQTKVLYAISK